MQPPISDDETTEISNTGKILIRAAVKGAQFDQALSNSQRLAKWIRERLSTPNRDQLVKRDVKPRIKQRNP